MKRITIEIDDDKHAEFKSKCYSEGTTIRDKVTKLIDDYLLTTKTQD